MPQTYTVDLEPVGRRVEVSPGETLLDAARAAGVELISLCGGIGACDSCKVRLIEGKLSRPSIAEEAEFSADELAAGWRLACQAEPRGDVKIDIPPDSLTTPQRLQVEGETGDLALDPVVTAVDLWLDPPSLADLRADLTRVNDALRQAGLTPLTMSLPVLAGVPVRLRAQDWSARLAVRQGREVVAMLPPDSVLVGFAVDIGTTGLAAYLVDLASGDILAKAGAMNPQIAYGEDVISRIVYINEHPDKRDLLQVRLVETLNTMLAGLCQEAGVSQEQVVEAVMVGNTIMHHIFAGLPVTQLGEAPYLPATSDALEFPAAAVGLELAAGAQVYMPPIIAGYVGADHVAALLATDTWKTARTVIMIDVGTNTELTLAYAGRRLSCSCASGPAFEGAHIRDGMRAAPGAIERVQLQDGQLRIQTIGHQPPTGICGSGILDTVAVMAAHGIIDGRGAFQTRHPLTGALDNGKAAFVLAAGSDSGHGREVAVTRQDVAEIQLAKGAIRAGIEILLADAGIAADDVEEFIIAGAFGTYINIASAVQIGMFPPVPLERFRQVGNAAGMGARQLLVSQTLRQQAAELVRQIEYVELTTHRGFQDVFVRSMSL